MTKPKTPIELLAKVETLRLRRVAAEKAGETLNVEGLGKVMTRTVAEYLADHRLTGIGQWSRILVLAVVQDAGMARFGRVLSRGELVTVAGQAMSQIPPAAWGEAFDTLRGTEFQDPATWLSRGLGILAAVIIVVGSPGPEGKARDVYLRSPALYTAIAVEALVAPALAVLEPPAGRIM